MLGGTHFRITVKTDKSGDSNKNYLYLKKITRLSKTREAYLGNLAVEAIPDTLDYDFVWYGAQKDEKGPEPADIKPQEQEKAKKALEFILKKLEKAPPIVVGKSGEKVSVSHQKDGTSHLDIKFNMTSPVYFIRMKNGLIDNIGNPRAVTQPLTDEQSVGGRKHKTKRKTRRKSKRKTKRKIKRKSKRKTKRKKLKRRRRKSKRR